MNFRFYKVFKSLSRAGKASAKYSNRFNLRNLAYDTDRSIDWKTVEKWKPVSTEEALWSSHKDISSSDFITAKLEKLEKWQIHVYDTIDNEGQELITLRWVDSEKHVNGKLKVKSTITHKIFETNSSFHVK